MPGTLPVLEHGDVKLFQHVAIENYLANLSPKYAELTPQQKGKGEQALLRIPCVPPNQPRPGPAQI